MRSTRSVVPVVPVLAVILALALTACGGGETKKNDTAAGSPSPSQARTTSLPPGRVKIAHGLPTGFPTDEIPLLDATVVTGAAGEPGSRYAWSVVMQPDGDIRQIAREAGKKLEDAGYRRGPGTDLDSLQVERYANDKYQVGVTVVKTGDGNTVTYVVSNKG
jgi:hypothetical protein